MINLNYFSSQINKVISFLLAFSLLAATFSFAVDENVKQEFSMLYKATSICEYYNSVTNFSYGVICKVLKSANINLAYSSVTSTGKKDKKTNKKNNRFDFVQPDDETGLKNFKFTNLSYVNILFSKNDFKFYAPENINFINAIFVLLFIFFSFCYFARGNIEDNIKFYNKIIKNRLV